MGAAPQGIYKTITSIPRTGYAHVQYGNEAALRTLPEEYYRARGFQPPFDALLTKDELNA